MYILAIDTTGPVCSVAVTDIETGMTKSASAAEPMGHLRRLAGLIEGLLAENGIDRKDIAAVAASSGPGSYTGIRIGVSTARGIAQALGVQAIKVPTLEQFRPEYAAPDEKSTAVILNARRGQVYGAVFTEDKPVLPPGPYMLADVTGAIRSAELDPLVFGDGIDAYEKDDKYSALLGGLRTADVPGRYQDAVRVAAYARKAYMRGDVTTVNGLVPDYMRKTEAEQRLADGSLEEARRRKMEKFRSM